MPLTGDCPWYVLSPPWASSLSRVLQHLTPLAQASQVCAMVPSVWQEDGGKEGPGPEAHGPRACTSPGPQLSPCLTPRPLPPTSVQAEQLDLRWDARQASPSRASPSLCPAPLPACSLAQAVFLAPFRFFNPEGSQLPTVSSARHSHQPRLAAAFPKASMGALRAGPSRLLSALYPEEPESAQALPWTTL